MFKRLLIATDGSDLAGKAVAAGLALAKGLDAQVVVFTATEPWTAMVSGEGFAFDFPVEEYEKDCAERAEQILKQVRGDADRLGLGCETMHANGFPAESILDAAKTKNCDLIVMASHGRRGISRLLLGSQAMRVVTLSNIPVLICR
jgi:nucleotide-binding universal stress UspA family protein